MPTVPLSRPLPRPPQPTRTPHPRNPIRPVATRGSAWRPVAPRLRTGAGRRCGGQLWLTMTEMPQPMAARTVAKQRTASARPAGPAVDRAPAGRVAVGAVARAGGLRARSPTENRAAGGSGEEAHQEDPPERVEVDPGGHEAASFISGAGVSEPVQAELTFSGVTGVRRETAKKAVEARTSRMKITTTPRVPPIPFAAQ